MATQTATVKIFGDEIQVHYNGNVWEAPSTHRTFTSARDAMRDELNEYYNASDDDLDDETADAILSHMVLS